MNNLEFTFDAAPWELLLEQAEDTVSALELLSSLEGVSEDEYEDGVNITPDEIYKWSDENKETPKTSAAGIEQTTEMMRHYGAGRKECSGDFRKNRAFEAACAVKLCGRYINLPS